MFAALSLGLTLWQWAMASRFPLHRRGGVGGAFAPSVTLLKPLKGCDGETLACLRSWLEQDYGGPVQILFGVAEANDSVCAAVRGLMAAYPKADAALVICAEKLGPNAKVSTLVQLEKLAKHDVIVVSDADVWVPADLLRELVAPLRDTAVGLVNCFYRLRNADNFAMRWEAFAVNADFWSQVLQAQALKPLDFAMGAVMATTRGQLKSIGHFSSLVNYLADDYQLGNRVARSGARIAICPVVVECRSSPQGWREVWAHQKRWARTIRVCQPAPYFFSVLSNATLWPALWIAWHPTMAGLLGGAVCLGTRVAAGMYCERKLTGRWSASGLWVAPLKDGLQVAIWALAFMGNHVTWRGERFRVQAGGRLVKV